MSAYVLLFLTAFGAATLLPFYSEVLLVAQLRQGLDPALLWFSATAGNTLGAVVNWGIGWHLTQYVDRRWFPVRKVDLERAQRWFQRYGSWTLLFSWAPLGGDALTVVAGVMKVRFWVFLPLVALGKGARYGGVIWATQAVVG